MPSVIADYTNPGADENRDQRLYYNSWISSAAVGRGQRLLHEAVSRWFPPPPAPAGYCEQLLLDSRKCCRLAGSLILHSRTDHSTRLGDSATLLPAFFNLINASISSPWGL
jgi:hypothetical protein